MWKHERALEVTKEILKAVVETEMVWRGDMLCCRSVDTKTLPRTLVENVFRKMGIVDSEATELGLSLYFSGGCKEYEKLSAGLPTLVMGVSLACPESSDADPSSKEVCRGVSGGMPHVFSLPYRIAVDVFCSICSIN
jgi:hypothetical protein